jgi:hypothetical protein
MDAEFEEELYDLEEAKEEEKPLQVEEPRGKANNLHSLFV